MGVNYDAVAGVGIEINNLLEFNKELLSTIIKDESDIDGELCDNILYSSKLTYNSVGSSYSGELEYYIFCDLDKTTFKYDIDGFIKEMDRIGFKGITIEDLEYIQEIFQW